MQKMDATINGLIILDTFASSVTPSLDDNNIKRPWAGTPSLDRRTREPMISPA